MSMMGCLRAGVSVVIVILKRGRIWREGGRKATPFAESTEMEACPPEARQTLCEWKKLIAFNVLVLCNKLSWKAHV